MIGIVFGLLFFIIALLGIISEKNNVVISLLVSVCLLSLILILASGINMGKDYEKEVILEKLIEDNKVVIDVNCNKFNYCLADSTLSKTFIHLTNDRK